MSSLVVVMVVLSRPNLVLPFDYQTVETMDSKNSNLPGKIMFRKEKDVAGRGENLSQGKH